MFSLKDKLYGLPIETIVDSEEVKKIIKPKKVKKEKKEYE